jgi:hypothetical protein
MARHTGRVFLAVIAFAVAGVARGELTQLEIATQRPYGSFRAGDYVYLEGKARGEISPQEASTIPGLGKATRNARGLVEYATRVILIIPADPMRGNGTLLVDIPNRGRAYAHALYNSPRGEPFQSGNLEQGTGFLQDHGFSVAEVYWELGQGAELPNFVDADGKKLYVEGAGFAIVRDVADFLKNGQADNPLRGAVKRVIGSGKSQSGRFLKTFLANGFNRAGDRRVFDGIHVLTSAGMLPLMRTGAGPESSANGIPLFDDVEWRGYTEEPLAVSQVLSQAQAKGAGAPKVLVQNATTDYYSIRSSLGRTGAAGTAELPLPANVRVYDMAGAPHAITPSAPSCAMKPGVLDWVPLSRALLLHLDRWIATGAEPPASRLMPLQAATAEDALRAPAHLPGAVIQVPKLDPDGNALGGVRVPDIQAPLGTHVGLNTTRTRGCMLVGGYVAFDAAKIAERYRGGRDDYVNRVRIAARNLMDEGFLLADDAAVIVESAASSRAFAKR